MRFCEGLKLRAYGFPNSFSCVNRGMHWKVLIWLRGVLKSECLWWGLNCKICFAHIVFIVLYEDEWFPWFCKCLLLHCLHLIAIHTHSHSMIDTQPWLKHSQCSTFDHHFTNIFYVWMHRPSSNLQFHCFILASMTNKPLISLTVRCLSGQQLSVCVAGMSTIADLETETHKALELEDTNIIKLIFGGSLFDFWLIVCIVFWLIFMIWSNNRCYLYFLREARAMWRIRNSAACIIHQLASGPEANNANLR